jgi:hypothetical protein
LADGTGDAERFFGADRQVVDYGRKTLFEESRKTGQPPRLAQGKKWRCSRASYK